MNLFAWFSLLTSGVSLTLGILVFLLDKKASVNRLFMFTMVFNAYWAFTEFMRYQAPNLEVATFWSKALFMWPFFAALLFHFSLAYTESDLLKSKWVYVLLYAPAVVFAVTDLTTNLISAPPILQYWGYAYAAPSDSWVVTIDSLYVSTLALLALIFCIVYYHRLTEPVKKNQTKYVVVGLSFPVILSIITDSILPVLGISFPSLGNLSGCIFSGFIAYAIWRYELFNLNPSVAAENILSAMPDSLILADMKGKIIRVNQAFTKFSGYNDKEVSGKQLPEMFLDQKSGEDTITKLIQDEEIKNVETILKTKTGEQRIVMFSGSVVRTKNGRDLGFTLVIHDVTQRKKMEAKLITAERFAPIGELAGMIGHDLRNPLSSMNAATYYLRSHYGAMMDATGKEMLSAIEKSITYSNEIVNDLLEYSREIKLAPEETTPKSLFANALTMVGVPANIQVIDTCEDSPKIEVDYTKVSRVLVNIIKNAFDAMPNGGTLTVASKCGESCLELSFTDTGVGMTPETMNKIWTPLFTTKTRGMGFGLAICKRIVEAHGGRISVASQLGKGTVFTLTFPLETPASQGVTVSLNSALLCMH